MWTHQHSIWVVTDHPLCNIFEGLEHSGRLVKWSVEQSESDISFVPRLSSNAKVMNCKYTYIYVH
ncbi:hypothetical protein KSP40_PGU000275 [Platanthera guangdongensis]|uniref:Uncharacterized protein n=1 Tax=Platanthera guangdongensis TaxID=2320717 RepID=A0ABR2MB59_9ASPA